MTKRISLTVLALASLGMMASCGQPGEDSAPESVSQVSQELGGCVSNAPVISQFKSVATITPDTIAGPDLLTPNFIVVIFHAPGSPVCVGEELGLTRYLHLPMSQYAAMRAAVLAGRKIRFQGKEGPPDLFTKVGWHAI